MKNNNYIGFWERVWMLIIDIILLSIGLYVWRLITSRLLGIDNGSEMGQLMQLLPPSLVTYFFWVKFGGTPGVLIRKAKIVDTETGSKPTRTKFLVRLISSVFSNASFFISYIFLGFDSRKQTWHDKISKTIIIRDRSDDLSFPTKQTKKDRAWFISGILLSIILISSVVVLINHILVDEPLLPLAKEWIELDITQEKNPEENSFYYMVGILSDPELSSYEEGYKAVQNLNKNFIENPTKKLKDVYNLSNDFPNTSKLEDVMQPLTYMIANNLFEYTSKNKSLITKIRNEYIHSLQRYEELTDYDYYQNSYYDSSRNDLMALYYLKNLNLANLILLYSEGKKQEALAILNTEIEFSRFLIESSETIEIKELACILFQNDLKAILDILQQDEKANFNELNLTYLSKKEISLKKLVKRDYSTMYNEFILPHQLKMALNGGLINLNPLLFRKSIEYNFNFASNRAYKFWKQYYDLEELSKEEFYSFEPEEVQYELSNLEKITGEEWLIPVPLFNSGLYQLHEIDAKIALIKHILEERK